MAASSEGIGLEQTPTYAVALTAFVFILISLLVERAIHRLKKYLKEKNQKPLQKVLDKMTEELMLLGFISLLLTVLQNSVVKICVTPNFAKHLLPCSETTYTDAALSPTEAPAASVSTFGRRLLTYYVSVEPMDVERTRRLMAEGAATGHCSSKGKVPFVSVEVLHQLHIFIFVLAVTHVCYSLATVLLGFARLHNWREWELETRVPGYEGNLDLERRYCDKIMCQHAPIIGLSGHQQAFVNRHANHWLYENRFTVWVLCFFQQFYASVKKEDYLAFRVGFLNKHNLGDSFNFRDYVVRSLEVDFKKVIGISWWLWLIVVLFLLLNVHGWYTYFWAAFVPTILVLAIGTKQQHIISTLALQAKKHAEQVLEREGKLPKGAAAISPALTPDNKLFWFDSPKFLLRLIHLIIFQNSFELAVFFWLVTAFGWNSCILGNHTLLIVRLVVGLCTQLLVSYGTLPIYALVTQMGTHLKGTVFTKDVREGLIGWKKAAERTRAKKSQENSGSNSEDNSQQFTENGSSEGGLPENGSTRGGSVEGHFPHEVTVDKLPSLSRERTSKSLNHAHHNHDHHDHDHNHYDDDPDPSLRKRCQLLYGKQGGLKILANAKVSPSGRERFTDLKEGDEEPPK